MLNSVISAALRRCAENRNIDMTAPVSAFLKVLALTRIKNSLYLLLLIDATQRQPGDLPIHSMLAG